MMESETQVCGYLGDLNKSLAIDFNISFDPISFYTSYTLSLNIKKKN